MSRNALTEILDVERSLDSGGEEASEWANERSERGEDKRMDLY
jgi:hypothetical protein